MLLIHFRRWQSSSSYQNDPCKKRRCLDVGWSPTRIWMYRRVRYRCILIANAQVGYEYCIFHPFLLNVKNFQTFLFCFFNVLIFGRKTERKAKLENKSKITSIFYYWKIWIFYQWNCSWILRDNYFFNLVNNSFFENEKMGKFDQLTKCHAWKIVYVFIEQLEKTA